MQMYDTREMEIRSRLGERRVDLVPPFRRHDEGLVVRLDPLPPLARPSAHRHPSVGRRPPSTREPRRVAPSPFVGGRWHDGPHDRPGIASRPGCRCSRRRAARRAPTARRCLEPRPYRRARRRAARRRGGHRQVDPALLAVRAARTGQPERHRTVRASRRGRAGARAVHLDPSGAGGQARTDDRTAVGWCGVAGPLAAAPEPGRRSIGSARPAAAVRGGRPHLRRARRRCRPSWSSSRTSTGPTSRPSASSGSPPGPSATSRLLVVCSFRSDELPRRHPLRPFLVEAGRQPGSRAHRRLAALVGRDR